VFAKKLALLKTLNFGARVAEDEANALESYFVETTQWSNIYNGRADIVYGAKGAGKSALYSLLLAREDALFDRSVILIRGENPRGAPAFRNLIDDPPSSEAEFVLMWKLYFLVLIADAFDTFGIAGVAARQVRDTLEAAGLTKGSQTLASVIRSVLDYVRSWMNPSKIETEVQTDATTGRVIYRGRITPREVSSDNRLADALSVDHLLNLANDALQASGYTIWLLLDRLDVAFTDNEDLEENALRALFKAYRDVADKANFRPKIFLRSDIWKRITEKGFREASHITATETVSWDKASLTSLIVRRAIQNKALCVAYNIDPAVVIESYSQQTELFERIFPLQVDLGEKKPSTIDWMLSRTQDGTKQTAPRELIHLLNSIVTEEVRRLEIGTPEAEGDNLFSRQAIKDALIPVSKARLEQTIYAEYPSLRNPIDRLDGGKSEYNVQSLAELWGVTLDESLVQAQRLVEIGLFEERGSKDQLSFWIPFLYRDALKIVQGAAF
jgi:hypothetical protein